MCRLGPACSSTARTRASSSGSSWRKRQPGSRLPWSTTSGPSRARARRDLGAPVQADHLGARLGQGLEKVPAPVAKRIRGTPHAGQRFHDPPVVGQGEGPVVRKAEDAGPGVKELDRLAAGLHLSQQLAGHGAAELVHQRVGRGGIAVEQLAAGWRSSWSCRPPPGTRPGSTARRRSRSAARPRPAPRGSADGLDRRRGSPRRGRGPSARPRRPWSRTGWCSTGPFSVSSTGAPMDSTAMRMSEKRIAASTPSSSTACTVTRAASSGVLHSSKKEVFSRMAR